MRSLAASSSAASSSVEAMDATERRYAVVSARTAPAVSSGKGGEALDATDWFAACYRLTPRVERISMRSAILDLGNCTEAEALLVLQELLDHLDQRGLSLRTGIGPTPVLAQFICGLAPDRDQPQSPPLLSLSHVSAFLKGTPIERLLLLAPPDAITVETLARLKRCGVRLLGQLARLDELTLRRQFGAAGAQLAALAQGRSLHPFSPTPQALCLRFRLRLESPLHADDALHKLLRLAAPMAKTLGEYRYEAGQVGVIIRWTSGERQYVSRRLRWRTSEARLLAQELARLLLPLLRQSRERQTRGQIEEIRYVLGELQRPQPPQAPLFPQGRSALSDRRQQVCALADTLAQRRKCDALLASRRVTEHAIFPEDGYVLTPLGSDTQAHVTHTGVAQSSATAQRQGHWQDAPLRLHWW